MSCVAETGNTIGIVLVSILLTDSLAFNTEYRYWCISSINASIGIAETQALILVSVLVLLRLKLP